MPPPSPRVAMLVNNAVHGDSRVQKVAWSMAARGYDVTLLGVQPAGSRERAELALGHARVVLVPRCEVLVSGGGRSGGAGYRAGQAAVRRWDALEVGSRDGVGRLRAGRRRLAASSASALASRPGLDRAVRTVGRTPLGRAGDLALGLLDPDGGWRQLNPFIQDVELALAPVLDDLEPDLVHAHDFHTVGIAARAAARARARGRRLRWLYDAHEYLAGTAETGLRGRLRHRFLVGQEREFAPLADAVVTVSEPIAELLQRDLGLTERPTVVLNVPPSAPADRDVPSLRDAAAADPSAPLLVYSGSCAPQRGVATAVEALGHLPDVVLAIVAAEHDRHVPPLLALASRLGVADRVRLVPFVTPDAVPAYLREADAGISPLLHRPNHELSLNTKYAEYVHAGLPVISSDVRTMAAFTRDRGNGEVFTAGDARSLAAAARRVLADPDRYRSAYAGGSIARSMSWEQQEDVLAGVYQRLTGTRPRPRPNHGPLALAPLG